MSGVVERLTENWLDNASERSFQLPFCYMLAQDGYRVVHLTRHCAMEMGKDVLAIAPDGTPCAYQLKGAPSSRITLGQWTKIQPQVFKLVQQSITHPSIDADKPHRSYLVTNGGLDEEVSHAIKELNSGWKASGLPFKLHVLTRGDLLEYARGLREGLWPTELGEVKALLELFLEDGKSLLSKKKLVTLLEATIPFEKMAGGRKVSANEFRRLASSTALLCGIATSNYVNEENHFAEVEAWTLYTAYLFSMVEMNGFSPDKCENELSLARMIIRNALENLAEEAIEKDWLIEGNSAYDQPFYQIRLTWLLGLLGIVALWRWKEGQRDRQFDGKYREFFEEHVSEYVLWGEAAIPYLLAAYYCYRKLNATPKPDFLFLGRILSVIAHRNQNGSEIALANPYYDVQSLLPYMIDNQLSEFLPERFFLTDLPFSDSFSGKSFYLEGMLHLFIRRNWKQTTKSIWSDVSKIQYQKFEPDTAADFFRWRTEEGINTDEMPKPKQKWDDLKSLAFESEGNKVPKSIKDDPILVLIFLCVFPHRVSPSLLRWLDTQMRDISRLY